MTAFWDRLVLCIFAARERGREVVRGALCDPQDGLCYPLFALVVVSLLALSCASPDIPSYPNQLVGTVDVGHGPLGVVLSPSGDVLYVANYASGDVTVVRTSDLSVVSTVDVGLSPDGIAVAPDGKKVYVGCYQSVTVIDPTNLEVVKCIPSGSYRLTDASCHTDGAFVYMTAYVPSDFPSSGILVVSTQTDTIDGSIAAGGDLWSIAISPDGSVAYVAAVGQQSIGVVDLDCREVVTQIPTCGAPVAISVSSTGEYVFLACAEGMLQKVAAASNTVEQTAVLGQSLRDVAVLSSGELVYASDATSGLVYLLNSEDLSIVDTVFVGGEPEDIAVHPGDSCVFVSNVANNTVSVIGY